VREFIRLRIKKIAVLVEGMVGALSQPNPSEPGSAFQLVVSNQQFKLGGNL
jgi:hypothetical protein